MSVDAVVARLRRVEDPALRAAVLRAAGCLHYARAGHFVRRNRTRAYLASEPNPRLHIGAGSSRRTGWLDTDLVGGEIFVDLGRRLPFAYGTFRYAFGEHVIEHLSQDAAKRLLAELRRVLRPGGVLRLTTPDLQKIIAIYEDANPIVTRREYAAFLDRETGREHARPAQVLNDYLRLWGHRHVYDEEDLRARLEEAGFSEVERLEPGESRHELLRGLETHGGEAWVNRAEAMTLEATRPAA